MLNRQELKKYRLLRGLSTRDVAFYCNLSQPMIVMLESGQRKVNKYNHDEYVAGVNAAYRAKRLGTFEKAPRKNRRKEAPGAKAKVVNEKGGINDKR